MLLIAATEIIIIRVRGATRDCGRKRRIIYIYNNS